MNNTLGRKEVDKPHQGSLLWFSSGIVLLIYIILWYISYTPPFMFLVSVLLIYISAPPKYLLSPRNFFFAYYFLWFTIPPMLASRYEYFRFSEPSEVLSYLMLVLTFLIGYITLFYAEERWKISTKTKAVELTDYYRKPKNRKISSYLKFLIFSAIVSALIAVVFVVTSSGGLIKWIENPGQAFLNRGGSGIYFIILIYSTSIAATITGYISYRSRKWLPIGLFLVFIFIISPVLGSKSRIFMTIVFLFLPWIFFLRVNFRDIKFIKINLVLVLTFFSVFTLGTWFRNFSWLTLREFVPYSLNYFSTYEMLVISVRDFDADFLQTVFLPFNKFLTPFGINDSNLFYDMSAWLTSIYFPEAWKIRATDQWPIETDLYLSFYYIVGIPLLIFFFFIIGILFNRAIKTRSMGDIFVSTYVSFHMVSHLRGGLILWTDFYLIPFWIFTYWILRKQLL